MGLDKIKSKAVALALVPTFSILPLTGCATEKKVERNKIYESSNVVESKNDIVTKETETFESGQHMVAYYYCFNSNLTAGIPQYEGYEIYDIIATKCGFTVVYVNTEDVEANLCVSDDNKISDSYCKVGKPVQKTLTK